MRYHHQLKRRRRFLPLHAYLLYLLTAAYLFTGATFARYVTLGDAGDGAEVAAAVLSTSASSGGLITLDGTEPSSYSFTVSNQEGDTVSQVALRYDVEVMLDRLPQGVTVTLDGEDGSCEGNTCMFSNAGTLPAGSQQTKEHTLTFTGPEDGASADSVQVTVSVHAEQID